MFLIVTEESAEEIDLDSLPHGSGFAGMTLDRFTQQSLIGYLVVWPGFAVLKKHVWQLTDTVWQVSDTLYTSG